MIRHLAGTFTTKLLSAVVNLVVVVMTTRYLGTLGKGEVSLIIANITLIQLLNNFIGGSSLVYLTPRHRTLLLMIPAYFWGVIASGAGVSLLYYLGQIDPDFLRHLFFLSVLFSWFSINQMFFLGKEKIWWHNVLSFLQVSVVLLGLIYAFVIAGTAQVSAYVAALYVSYGICFLVSFILVIKLVVMPDFRHFRQALHGILSYGFTAQMAAVITFFNYRLSYYLLDYWKGKDAVGIYSTGVSIAEATWMLSKSIALVQYSKISNEKDEQRAVRLTNSLTKMSFWVALLIVLTLLALPRFIYTWIFGPGFGQIHTVILTLALGILSISFSTTFLHYFSGKGEYGIVNRATALALFFTVVLSILLLPPLGITGAGITASIAYLAQSIYLYVVYHRRTGFRISELLNIREEIKRIR